MPKRKIHVKPYDRTRFGKVEKVAYETGGYYRDVNANTAFLKQLSSTTANQLNIERYMKTHPDAIHNARMTFRYPNPYWRKHPNKCDALYIDSMDAPEVKVLPKTGIPTTVVKYKGRMYEADINGEYKTVQKDIRDFAKVRNKASKNKSDQKGQKGPIEFYFAKDKSGEEITKRYPSKVILQPEAIKENEKKKMMIKKLPDNLVKGMKAVAKDRYEYSFALDFERKLKQPQRGIILKGAKDTSQVIEDFELFGHTHSDEDYPLPSVLDLQDLKVLKPELIIAGKTGKTIIINIEDLETYEKWKLSTPRDKYSHPISFTKFLDYINNNPKYQGKLNDSDYDTLSKSKVGKELIFEETGVKIYPYRKTTRIELIDDPKFEKPVPTVSSKVWEKNKTI